MRLIKCDRCGRVMDPKEYENTGYVKVIWRSIWTSNDESLNPFEDWDLCEPCIDKIIDFVRNDPKEKKHEEILNSVDAGKKKKPYPGSGPTFDVKKAQALRDAGWPLTKIAKEVGVSDVTVAKWTHTPEPKQARPHEWAEHEPVLGKDAVPRKEEDDEQVD